MNNPKRIIVEHEDGTRREASFDKLGKQGRAELSVLGLCDAPLPEAHKNYLILQWKDGWKEVIAADSGVVELMRYYTIERVERIGRLSLEVAGDAYPELLFVKRLPDQVENILLIGSDRPQGYTLKEKVTVREGGKTEHIFYDKKRPDFSMEETAVASTRYAAILYSIKTELIKRGYQASTVLAMSEEKRIPVYGELARSCRLKGSQKQQDVYGFIQLAIERLNSTSS